MGDEMARMTFKTMFLSPYLTFANLWPDEALRHMNKHSIRATVASGDRRPSWRSQRLMVGSAERNVPDSWATQAVIHLDTEA